MAIKRKRRRLSKGKQCGKSWQAMGKQAGKQANDEQTSKAKQGKASKQASQQACMSSVAPAPSLTQLRDSSQSHALSFRGGDP